MVFDGTRESCPNKDDEGGLDMSYIYFTDFIPMRDDPSFGTPDFNRECFNICEAKPEGAGEDPRVYTYIENGVCKPCPNDNEVDKIEDLKTAGLFGMCSNFRENLIEGDDNTPIWFSRQQDSNLRGDFMNRVDWTSDNERGPRSFWKSAQRGMTINEINRFLGGKKIFGTDNYSYPEGYEDDEQGLRDAINQGRGSVVLCNDDTKPATKLEAGNLVPFLLDDCDLNQSGDGGLHFTSDFIVPEEVRDFYIEQMDRGLTDTSDRRAVQTFSELLSGLAGDSTFEKCVNDRLNTGILNRDGDDDETIQSRIASYDNLAQFQNSDIHYLKRKLRRIVTIKTDEVNECMNLLNLGKSVCRTGVADKTLQIGRLIFSIIGNDRIDVLNMNNEEQIKLNKMIDELGPLIPQAVKNIIHVSKEYEARICNVPSNTTLLLERVYMDLYDKPTEINLDFSPYIDFNSLINIDDNVRFIKTIFVLVVFAYLLMHFSNIIVAFLSRGSNVTKIT